MSKMNDIAVYKVIFEKYDLNRDGIIDDQELRELLVDAGEEPTKHNLIRKLKYFHKS